MLLDILLIAAGSFFVGLRWREDSLSARMDRVLTGIGVLILIAFVSQTPADQEAAPTALTAE